MAKLIFKPVCSNCGYLIIMPVTVYQNSCNKIIPRTCPCCDEPFEGAELVAKGLVDDRTGETSITFYTDTV